MEAVDRALGIYIKGVSEETTEVDLQSTFSQFGLITETVIKGERGWALVQSKETPCITHCFFWWCGAGLL